MRKNANVVTLRHGVPPTVAERKKRAQIISFHPTPKIGVRLNPEEKISYGFNYLKKRVFQVGGYEIGVAHRKGEEPRIVIKRPQTATHQFLRLIVQDKASRELAELFGPLGIMNENPAAFTERMQQEIRNRFPLRKFKERFNRILNRKEFELRTGEQ